MSFIAEWFEWRIDFEGQKLSENVTQGILILFAVLGFGIGYIQQSLQLTLLIFASGFVLSLIAVIPPWPVYNKHPIQWLSQSTVVVEENISEEPETPTGTYKVEEIELE